MQNLLTTTFPEKAIQRYPSVSQLQKLFDASLDVICSFDKEGRFLSVNKAAYRMWGYHPAELIGQYYIDLVLQEDRQLTNEAAKKIMQGVNMTFFENRYLHKKGHPVPLQWSAHWDEKEKTMFCIARDASAKKNEEATRFRYEEEIRKQHAAISNMLESISDGFFALDETFKIVYCTERAEEILNIKKEHYLNRNFWECFPGIRNTVFYSNYHKALHEKIPVHFEEYFPPFNCWYAIHAYPSDTGLSIFFQDINERKLAEEEIQKSHARFELAAKIEALYDWDIPSEKLYWGEGLLTFFGYTTSEMQMNEWNNALHPDDRNRVLDYLLKTLTNPGLNNFEAEYRLRKRDETYAFVHEKAHIIRDKTGTAIRMVGFMQDVTERKKAEAERFAYEVKIERKNALLTNILEGMKDGFFSLDHMFKVLYWNRMAEEITGISKETALGSCLADLYSRQAIEFYSPLFQQALQNRTPYQQEVFCPQNKRWVEMSIYPSNEGCSVFIKDINKRKETEDELQKLSLVAKETENGVMLTNAARQIVWINAAFTRMTGYSFDEAVGRSPVELLSGPETSKETIGYIQKQFQEAKTFQVEIINYRKNKEKFWSELHGQPLFDEAGKLQHFFYLRKDITERKKLEEELKLQHKKTSAVVIAAQERERALVGRELHDNVNQVLTSVKLYQELIASGVGNQEELIKKSTELLQQSINEIRSLSKRLSAPTLGNIRLKDSIKELVGTVAATKKFQITLDTSVIDEIEVEQELHLAIYRIVQEHLTNILKYADAKNVEVRFDFTRGNLLLDIYDDGRGFDTKEKRTGLGITNMAMRAESLHGSLLIKSEPMKGCRLSVRFPLIRCAE